MEFLSNITHFLFDKERSLTRKAALTVLIAFGIYFTDDVLGFSDSYNTERKIEQVGSINAVIADSTLDSATKYELLALRSHIVRRRSAKVKFEDWLLSLSWSKEKTEKIIENTANNPQIIKKYNYDVPRSNLWFLLSTSGLLILLEFVLILSSFFLGKMSVLIKIANSMTILLISIASSGFMYWLFDVITTATNGPILGNWTYNYILNWTIQFVFFILPFFFIAKANKKRIQGL